MIILTRKGLNDLALDCGKKAYFFDFDGTLVELVSDPKAVQVPSLLIADIAKLEKDDAFAFAIVTGRTLDALDAFLGGVKTSAVACHGAEYRPLGGARVELLAQHLPEEVSAAMRAVAVQQNALLEDKEYSLSLHLSLDHEHEDITPILCAALEGHRQNYTVRKVGRTYEVNPRTIGKGNGIRRLMDQPPFKGKTPIYIGDDAMTDDSLCVVTELGGTLVSVRRPDAVGDKRTELSPLDIRAFLSGLVSCSASDDFVRD